jgi:phosphatidylserine/phosphatidylglycerophosphate/cardiolipin synthase-like enzyme
VSALVEVSLPDLERLAHALDRLGGTTKLTREALVRCQLDALSPQLRGLVGRDVEVVRAVLGAVIAERRRPPTTGVSLVWTGPETRASGARDTAVVVRELFEGAKGHVLVAGYSFEKGESILAPLHAAMRDRGVAVEMFVHLDEAESTPMDPEWYLRTQAAAWRTRYWPFGAPTPTLYVDPRAAVPRSRASLHAKCIVIDGARALVGSANFTDRGHARNIEAGVLVDDTRFATELARQFHDAVGQRLFVEV